MKLNELNNDKNKRQNRKRIGRGIGSGKGVTGGRGQKGQTSRSGVSINGFEGGQMPIYMRVPKRGFVNPFRIKYQSFGLSKLQEFIDDGRIKEKDIIDRKLLLEAGLINRKDRPVKILCNGSIKSAVKIQVESASKNAIKAIEKAGGSVEIIAKKSAEKKSKKG